MTHAAAENVFANARVVLADETILGAVKVRDGTIADIGAGSGVPAGAVDLEGDYLIPGLVEVHTDNLEKHLSPRIGVFWPAFPALMSHDAQIAAAGITTVFDAVSLGDRDGREERLHCLGSAMAAIAAGQSSGHLRSEHFLHLRCEVPTAHAYDLFCEFSGSPSVRFVSLMDHTPGDRQFSDIDRFRAMCLENGETPDSLEARIAAEREKQAAYADGNRLRIATDAQRSGMVLASHDDASLEHVQEAAALGVTVAEFPTTMTAAQAAHAHGMKIVMGAPNVIRGGSHSGNVAAHELAQVGLLDALSSDYMPVSLLHAPFRLRDQLGWSLAKGVCVVSRNPAQMMRFDDRGEIAVGKRADLVRVVEFEHTPIVKEVWRAGRRIT